MALIDFLGAGLPQNFQFVEKAVSAKPWVPSFCFPGGSVVKNLPTDAEDARAKSSASGSGRSLGEGRGYKEIPVRT